MPVRDQGARSTCLSFAFTSAHEYAGAQSSELSVEYHYFHAISRTPGGNPFGGTVMKAAADAMVFDGQPPEFDWPYEAVQGVAPNWTPPPKLSAIYLAKASISTLTLEQIISELKLGKAVVLGLVITDSFMRADGDGVLPIIANDRARGGHAVLAVGYGLDSSKNKHILIRNSWGPHWGDQGHAWLRKAYVDAQLRDTAVVTV